MEVVYASQRDRMESSASLRTSVEVWGGLCTNAASAGNFVLRRILRDFVTRRAM